MTNDKSISTDQVFTLIKNAEDIGATRFGNQIEVKDKHFIICFMVNSDSSPSPGTSNELFNQEVIDIFEAKEELEKDPEIDNLVDSQCKIFYNDYEIYSSDNDETNNKIVNMLTEQMNQLNDKVFYDLDEFISDLEN